MCVLVGYIGSFGRGVGILVYSFSKYYVFLDKFGRCFIFRVRFFRGGFSVRLGRLLVEIG